MSIKRDRMSDRVRQILSELLLREVGDPRLQGVTITEVRLDPELMFADIYVNALGDEGRKNEVLGGLKRANGFLRREVGKRVRLRNTPELHFHWDASLERGEHINRVLDRLRRESQSPTPPAADDAASNIVPLPVTDDLTDDDEGTHDDD